MIERLDKAVVFLIESFTASDLDTSMNERLLGLTDAEVRSFSSPQQALEHVERNAELADLTVLDTAFITQGQQPWIQRLAEAGLAPIILSAHEGEEALIGRGLNQGAVDFFRTTRMSERPGRLAQVLQQALTRYSLQNASRQCESKAARNEGTANLLEMRDPLEAFVRESLHEFCTPLTVVREFVSILEDKLAGPLTDKQGEYLGYIHDASEEMLEMFDAFRDAVRHRRLGLSSEPTACQTATLFRSVLGYVEPRQLSKNIEISETIEAGAEAVYGDQRQMIQVVSTLLRRAVRCSPHNGAVSLWARPTTDGRLMIGTTDQGPAPTAGDIAILRDGSLEDDFHHRSVTRVFGVGMELARSLARINFGEIGLAPSSEGGAHLTVILPSAAAVSAGAATPA